MIKENIICNGNSVSLEYETDNSAFDGIEYTLHGLQLDRVVRIIKTAEKAGMNNVHGNLLDINGNTVGKWRVDL